jgi:hypothetical protein
MATRRSTRITTMTTAEEPPKKKTKLATARQTTARQTIETPEQEAMRIKYESELSKVKENLLNQTFNYYKNLLLKPSQNINQINNIYYTVWVNYIGNNLSYDVNRYLRDGMPASFEISNDGDLEELYRTFMTIVDYLVDDNPIKPNATDKSLIDVLAKGLGMKGCPPDKCIIHAQDLIWETKDNVKKMLSKMSTTEKLNTLINFADQSFSAVGPIIIGQDLTRTTSENEIFYRGIGNFSPQDYITDIENNPANPAYLSTSTDEKIAAWHAKRRTEAQGGDELNKFVIKYVCDPGIRVIDTLLALHTPVQASEKECIFPRGCYSTYVSTEVLQQYSTQEPVDQDNVKKSTSKGVEIINAPLTIITVKLSGPSASSADVGGRSRKSRRKGRRKISRKSRRH